MFSHVHSPSFCSTFCKGPSLISPRKYRRKDSPQLPPALVSPLSDAPKAAQCCHHVPGPRNATSDTRRAGPASGSSGSFDPHRKEGGQTSSYRARSPSGDRHSVILLSPSSRTPTTRTCFPTVWNGVGYAHPSEAVRQHRPPAAERNAEQEHMYIGIPFPVLPLCSTRAVSEAS